MLELLEEEGEVPLPPYIERQATAEDAADYQTVYARVPGAVAAPTAGLHFTASMLDALLTRAVKSRSPRTPDVSCSSSSSTADQNGRPVSL